MYDFKHAINDKKVVANLFTVDDVRTAFRWVDFTKSVSHDYVDLSILNKIQGKVDVKILEAMRLNAF